jgi:hypothetical protein
MSSSRSKAALPSGLPGGSVGFAGNSSAHVSTLSPFSLPIPPELPSIQLPESPPPVASRELAAIDSACSS